jgi:hypothetical protein
VGYLLDWTKWGSDACTIGGGPKVDTTLNLGVRRRGDLGFGWPLLPRVIQWRSQDNKVV